MGQNKPGSIWRSTPRERRHHVEARWTIHRDVVDTIRERASAEGVYPSALVERILRDVLRLPPSDA